MFRIGIRCMLMRGIILCNFLGRERLGLGSRPSPPEMNVDEQDGLLTSSRSFYISRIVSQ